MDRSPRDIVPGTSAPRPLRAGAPSSQAAYPPPSPDLLWSRAASLGPPANLSPSRAGEGWEPHWSWTEDPYPVSQGLLASLLLICKTGIDQGLPPTVVESTHTSSLDHSQGFRKRNFAECHTSGQLVWTVPLSAHP